MRLCTRFLFASALCFAASFSCSAFAATVDCQTATHLKACSYEAVNGSCTVTIDRSHPITPPTIYIRKNQCVQVQVVNPSPFERLSLDLKSIAPQPQADQLANGFTSITSVLGSFSVVSQQQQTSNTSFAARFQASQEYDEAFVPETTKDSHQAQSKKNKIADDKRTLAERQTTEFENLSHEITNDLTALKNLGDPMTSMSVVTILKQVHQFLQPLSPQVCNDFPLNQCPYNPDTGAWDLTQWKQSTHDQIANAMPSPTVLNGVAASAQSLKDRIASFTVTSGSTQAEIGLLNSQFSTLTGALDAFNQTKNILQDLQAAIDGLSVPSAGTIVIRTFSIGPNSGSGDNIQVISKTLNSTNRLAAVAKRISGAKYQDANAYALSNLANADTLNPVTTVTVQFENQPRFELSSGIVFPVTPYHSYTAVQPFMSQGCAPNCPAPFVQQNLTYSVTPVVVANFLLGNDLVLRGKRRGAFFLTLGAGYNSAVSAPAFVGGMSFSYRSMVFNFLADGSRDTQLGPGYTVNGPLNGASAPATTSYWTVKFAPGISIRIPLNSTSQ